MKFKFSNEEEVEITYTEEQLKESEEEGYQRGVVDGTNVGRKEAFELNHKIHDIIVNIVPQMEQFFIISSFNEAIPQLS